MRYEDDPDSYFMNADKARRKPKDEDEGPYISERAPARIFKDLSEINLDSELTTQFAEATAFRDHILQNSEHFQTREVTDTVKTCNVLIANIIKMKESVHTLDRMKAFEDAVIACMKQQPEEVRLAFFELLEKELPK